MLFRSQFQIKSSFIVNNSSNFSFIFDYVQKNPFSFKLTLNTKISMSNETRDTVFIGKKPLMAYVTSTLIQLANLPSVSIKARGMSIGRAVDVAQIIARKTENAGYTIGEIKIDSEALESQDGRTRNVSTIEIKIERALNS